MKDTLSKEQDEEIAKKARKEELLAAGQYDEHLSKAHSKKLKRILKHNQKDEVEDHAAKLKAYALEEEAKENKVKRVYA
jgi:hypothetical protein